MYNNLNSVILEGNLTKTPNLFHTGKGTSICNFSIASNRFYRHDDETINEVSYIDVEAWSKLGEICAEKLDKGRGVRVVGRIKQDRWEDAEGKTHCKHKIIAEHIEFKPTKKEPRQQYTQELANKIDKEIEKQELNLEAL